MHLTRTFTYITKYTLHNCHRDWLTLWRSFSQLNSALMKYSHVHWFFFFIFYCRRERRFRSGNFVTWRKHDFYFDTHFFTSISQLSSIFLFRLLLLLLLLLTHLCEKKRQFFVYWHSFHSHFIFLNGRR